MPADRIAIIAIGRNEGERLRRCLESVIGKGDLVVYVDSGSTDGSPELARDLGATVIDLDLSVPFTAARARQTGLEDVLKSMPDAEYIFYIDGDCVLQEGFIEAAAAHMAAHDRVAAVCARRQEEQVDSSIMSRLIDVDWNVAPGVVPYIGGDGLVRVTALKQVGGWSTDLIAGEEPDLCFRMQDAGWEIYRLPIAMTRHDVAMSGVGEYFKRSIRSGYAFLEVGLRHRTGAGRSWLRSAASTVIHGAMLPIAVVACAFIFWPISAIAGLLYLRLPVRMTLWCRRKGYTWRLSLLYGLLNTACKTTGVMGMIKYLFNRMTGRRGRIIEYKGPADRAAVAKSTEAHL